MPLVVEFILAATAAALGALAMRVLMRRNRMPAPVAGAWAGLRHDVEANALGFLLVGSLVAASGLLADLLCRVIQLGA